MGPEVAEFEADLAVFSGAATVVSCASGTDALALILMAKGVGPGDAVLCPSFTFAATAEVVAWVGATPVFVDVLRSIRVHGQGSDRYDNVRIGMTSRLDTIQAAVLIEKLKIFADEIERRDAIASRYNEALAEVAIVPRLAPGATSVWAQYTIRVDPAKRASLAAALKTKGIPTAIYYPKPLHQQTAYRHFPCAGNGLPVSETLAQEVISLPMHPYLDAALQDRIVAVVRDALR
jgi:dTDP-4-amino-4,6-dideoxygalactose transaminase